MTKPTWQRQASQVETINETQSMEALQAIRKDVVGRLLPVHGPFGEVPLVYADWTASGRPLQSIEKYITNFVMPLYGNTHTTASLVGNKCTLFQAEARTIVAEHVHADPEKDCVIFCGSGSTAAIAKFVMLLGLNRNYLRSTPTNDIPVVLVGPFEHHSNLLPWKESCAEVVTVNDKAWSGNSNESRCAGIDMEHLEQLLKKYESRKLVIGSFSAASNVTGFLSNTESISALLHKYGALACWDCATAGPHTDIRMNSSTSRHKSSNTYKDAIFLSGHKYVGGPGTPGILVVKKNVLKNKVPAMPGGGSVLYVTDSDHKYLSNVEEREEAGSPDLLGIVRLGLVMLAHQQFSISHAMDLERSITQVVLNSLKQNPQIVILGEDSQNKSSIKRPGTPKLPIFSFLIKYRSERNTELYFHYNFVCVLLNDLFGIQSRGGCMCAGPYAMRLLGITDASFFIDQLMLKNALFKPGFTRVSFTAFDSKEKIEYILHAIHYIAEFGYLFLPLYQVNSLSGEWKHRKGFDCAFSNRCLRQFNVLEKECDDALCHGPTDGKSEAETLLQAKLNAESEVKRAKLDFQENCLVALHSHKTNVLPAVTEKKRWFAYPWEDILQRETNYETKHEKIFDPQLYFSIPGKEILVRKLEKEKDVALLESNGICCVMGKVIDDTINPITTGYNAVTENLSAEEDMVEGNKISRQHREAQLCEPMGLNNGNIKLVTCKCIVS